MTGLVQTGLLVFSAGVIFLITDRGVHCRVAELPKMQLIAALEFVTSLGLCDWLVWLCILESLAAVRSSVEGLQNWYI